MVKASPESRFAAAVVQVAAARAEREATRRRPMQCKLCKFMRDEPVADAEYIHAMLLNLEIGSKYITEVLAAGGANIGLTSVKRHRKDHLGL